jgi:hypothetical protein
MILTIDIIDYICHLKKFFQIIFTKYIFSYSKKIILLFK